MKKHTISLLVCLIAVNAYAGPDNKKVTSQAYFDPLATEKQPTIPAINEKTVMTHTGQKGVIGTKAIYDTTGTYDDQTDALIDAETVNTAIQNAIDSELTRIENPLGALWRINDIAASDCDNTATMFLYPTQSMCVGVDDNFMSNYTVESGRTLTYENGIATCTWPSSDEAINSNNGFLGRQNIQFIGEHKYASVAYVNATNGAAYNIGISGSGNALIGNVASLYGNGTWQWVALALNCVSTVSAARINYRVQTRGATLQVKHMYLVDLTEIFGAGNEPTTAEQILNKLVSSCAPFIPQS